MNHHVSSLVNGYLDGMLTEGEEGELSVWLKAAPENAMAFAEMVKLHDRLHAVLRTRAEIEATPGDKPEPARTAVGWQVWRQVSVVGGLVALVAIAFTAVWWGNPRQVSAATELDRLIDQADTRDRSYIIRNLDDRPEQTNDRQPPIDGAMLHVRYPDQYVLIRKFPDGRPFATGSDGERSWVIPPGGATVRVSRDPMRFRGPVPGHQHGIPFVNLRSDLVQLREAYTVSPLGPNAAGQRGLLALKKSSDYRGPNRVELWYDADTGVIHRMVFAGMPKARGGPDSVAVELVDQRDQGADFFKHQSHHAPDRRMVEED
jgi:hypothetical protein